MGWNPLESFRVLNDSTGSYRIRNYTIGYLVQGIGYVVITVTGYCLLVAPVIQGAYRALSR